MPEPILTQVFSSILGDHEGIGILSIADWLSPDSSQNIRIDKFGRLRKILGFTAANGTPVTTDTGAVATEVHALFEYWGGATVPKIIGIFYDATLYGGSFTAGQEYELWVSTDAGATFTFSKDMGQHGTPVASDFNPVPTAFEFGDKLYVAIKGETPQEYNGTAFSDAGPSQSPTPSVSSGSAGSPAGTYQIRLVSMVGNDRQAGSAISTAVQLNSTQGDVTWTADTDTTVTGYEVYATTGTGKEFFFVDYVDGRTTAAYTFDKSDREIFTGRPLDRHGDAPISDLQLNALHKNRGWWGRTTANPSRLYFSDPFQPAEVSPNSFFDIQGAVKGDDELTALVGGFFDSLVVFKERAIFRVTGTGEYINGVPDYTVRETNASIGTVSQQSVVRVPAGAKYLDEGGNTQTTSTANLAYFAPDNSIRLFDGDSDTIISYPKTDGIGAAAAKLQQWHYFAQHDPELKEITWIYTTDNATSGVNENNRGIVWNYRWGAWTEITNAPFSCGLTTRAADGTQLLLTGSVGSGGGTGTAQGTVYKDKTGNSYNGAGNNITASWASKPLYGIDENGAAPMGKTKRWRRIYLVADSQSAGQNLTINWYENFAVDGTSPDGIATVDMSAIVPVAVDGNHGQHKIVMKNSSGDYLHSKVTRVEFTDTADDPAWGVPGFSIQYQILEGEKGR